jgi:hypothetical protein
VPGRLKYLFNEIRVGGINNDANSNFYKDVKAAIDYLVTTPEGDALIGKFTCSGCPDVTIVPSGVDLSYRSTMEVEWDPNGAVRFPDGTTQSPAVGFAHELGHLLSSNLTYWWRKMWSDPAYGNLEERHVIVDIETPIARGLGEGTRNCYCGKEFWVTGPTQR